MLKRTTFAVLFCFLSLTAAWAGERSDADMRTIALQHLAAHQANTRGAALESDICELARREAYSVFGLSQGQGFVVVSRSTAFHPVLATSETRFDADNLPDGLKWWLEAINESLLTREAAAPTRAYTPVENFVMTQWDQGAPYNSMTPEIGGKHTPTGCVATAMAQVLKYYNYPEKSEGISYYNVGNDPTDIRNEFNTTFKWDLILVSYDGDSSDESKQALGELMRDCGYSVKMQYDRNGSAAQYTNAALGFVRNMCFKEGYVHNANRWFYTDEEWMDIIEREMTAHRPILYGGNDGKSTGHAFVFSGLDEDGKVYVNWGWSGSGDGYYDVANLAPTGAGVTGSNDFSQSQHMVYGLTPDPDLTVFHPKFSEWAFYEEGNYTLTPSSVAGRVSVGAEKTLYNFYYTTFRGTIDLVVISKETGQNDAFTIYETEGVQPYYGLDFSLISTSKRLVNLKKLPAGVYTAFLGSKAHSDVEYQPVRSRDGAIAYEITIAEDGSISVSDPMHFDGTTVTAIRSPKVAAPEASDALYDLQGRRVTDPQRHGVYILNGKKVIR